MSLYQVKETEPPPARRCQRRASHTLHVGGRGPVPRLRRAPLWGRPAARDGPRCALALRGAPVRLAGAPALLARPPRLLRCARWPCGRRGCLPRLRCCAARPFSATPGGPPLRPPWGPARPLRPVGAAPPALPPPCGLALAARALPVRSGLLRCGLGLGAPRCGRFACRPCGGPGSPPRLFSGLRSRRGGLNGLPGPLGPSAPFVGALRPPGVGLRGGGLSFVAAACRVRGSPYLPPRPCRPAGARGGRVAGLWVAPSFRAPQNRVTPPPALRRRGLPLRVTIQFL